MGGVEGAQIWRASDPNRSLISVCKLQLLRPCRRSRISILLPSLSVTSFPFITPTNHCLFPGLRLSCLLCSRSHRVSLYSSFTFLAVTFWFSPHNLFPPLTSLPLDLTFLSFYLVAWQIMLAVHWATVDLIMAHFTGIFMWSVCAVSSPGSEWESQPHEAVSFPALQPFYPDCRQDVVTLSLSNTHTLHKQPCTAAMTLPIILKHFCLAFLFSPPSLHCSYVMLHRTHTHTCFYYTVRTNDWLQPGGIHPFWRV